MEEWRTIPGFPGYVISDDGVLVSPHGRLISPVGAQGNQYNVTPPEGERKKLTRECLLKMAKKGVAVPTPVIKAVSPKKEPVRNSTQTMIQKRRCHDCGCLTWDYRCQDCLTKWRLKHGVPVHGDDQSFDLIYGWHSTGGGKHVRQD